VLPRKDAMPALSEELVYAGAETERGAHAGRI